MDLGKECGQSYTWKNKLLFVYDTNVGRVYHTACLNWDVDILAWARNELEEEVLEKVINLEVKRI